MGGGPTGTEKQPSDQRANVLASKPVDNNHDIYYAWSGTKYNAFVRIRRFEGSADPLWQDIRVHRHLLIRRIGAGWALARPRSTWGVDQWNDFRDWGRALGVLDSRWPFRQPNLLIQIGYGDRPFFVEAFRLTGRGLTLAECATVLGDFVRLLLERLPPSGMEKDGVIIPRLDSDKTQEFWLGIVLQASRKVRGTVNHE